MPKLSIITINYNDRKGLEVTMQSVLSQNFIDFEYIVVDGGSKDGSREVIERYKDRLAYWVSEPDSGIYNAMNKGASKAKGEYLMFLNSGDCLYDENTLADLNIESFRDDIVSGCVYNYASTENVAKKVPPKKVSLFTFTSGSLPHPSSFIKRELFERIGGYHENYRIISDWCFFVEATLVENCSYSTVDNVVVLFNRSGISSTQGFKEEKDKNEFLLSLFARNMNDYTLPEDEALSNVVFWLSENKGLLGKLLRIPFKLMNRYLKLRNRLSRRMGIYDASKLSNFKEIQSRIKDVGLIGDDK